MNAPFSALEAKPEDALLKIMAAYREDPRPEKIDLGVGVYRDANGDTPVLRAVRAAERRLAENADTKSYEGLFGNKAFCAAVERLVFGANDGAGRRVASASCGGSGAVCLALSLVKRARSDATAWISDPTWPNHPHIARSVGLNVATYAYRRGESGVDVDAILDALRDARAGDAFVVQGPCHNPTGSDFGVDAWRALADACETRGLVMVIDTAYHGLGVSLEDDAAGVAAAFERTGTAMLTYSCSKNFGLYRDRSGCLIVQAPDAGQASAIASTIADVNRAMISMPPAHGPAIVETILADEALRADWVGELSEMRERIRAVRRRFAGALAARTNDGALARIADEAGMFALLPFGQGAAARLRAERAVYAPDSGRVNLAGMREDNAEEVAALIAPALRSAAA